MLVHGGHDEQPTDGRERSNRGEEAGRSDAVVVGQE
jgi:hypothetical protein